MPGPNSTEPASPITITTPDGRVVATNQTTEPITHDQARVAQEAADANQGRQLVETQAPRFDGTTLDAPDGFGVREGLAATGTGLVVGVLAVAAAVKLAKLVKIPKE